MLGVCDPSRGVSMGGWSSLGGKRGLAWRGHHDNDNGWVVGLAQVGGGPAWRRWRSGLGVPHDNDNENDNDDAYMTPSGRPDF